MTSSENSNKIYFLGIGGTGMAQTAGLAKALGHEVIGTDMNIYPPMSDMLRDQKIKVHCGYNKNNIPSPKPDLAVVANALGSDNVEIKELQKLKIPLESFPGFIEKFVLPSRIPVVISGTHGKTTTTALLVHLLESLGHSPGYLIGGLPKGKKSGFSLGNHPLFILEGDEYDTAFFDKGPKFLHYNPQYLIINNIEFDHADIYENLEQIQDNFKLLASKVSNPARIVTNTDDDNTFSCILGLGLRGKTRGFGNGRLPHLENVGFDIDGNHETVNFQSKLWGTISLKPAIFGRHNYHNISAVISLIEQLYADEVLGQICTKNELVSALESFSGVSRRLQLIGQTNDIMVMEDFAHHPTSVHAVIETLHHIHPNRRLVVAFEPKNATSRRNIFLNRYAKAFSNADRVFIGPCPIDERLAHDEKMDIFKLADEIGNYATAHSSNEQLLDQLVDESKTGDAIILMSCGAFSGVPQLIMERLNEKFTT